ncbi:MAG TPA: hydrogenase 3 maturation endopeptidase HyCI [Anaerolineales bacterium]|nr:hydrogenase 3 maturation endopeptidase HyCI [Anaerolineales bacterium]
MAAAWKESLHELLSQRRSEPDKSPRIAILGVGNPMRSDDAAGVLVARLLLQRDLAPEADRVLIIEAGHAPENRTGELRRFLPDIVLIIDAADMGETPGTVQWIPEESIDGMNASTHSLPLSMLSRYLKLELNCTVAVLGIQAASNEVGESVSPDVFQAIHEIVNEMERFVRDVN